MVEYDSQNNALTLGDDDALSVGEYDLEYNSTDDEFQIVSPDGNINSVPRSTSGSLVPDGLAESVAAGEALADDGNTYSSVQTAVDNASGWVFVGPGTFNESVTISTAGLTLEGSGNRTTVKFVGDDNTLYIDNSDVTVDSLSIENASSGSSAVLTNTTASNTTLSNLYIDGAGDRGIESQGPDSLIINCRVTNAPTVCIDADATRNVVTRCYVADGVGSGINIGEDDGIASFNVIENMVQEGINSFDDSIIIGNVIRDTGSFGIIIGGDIDSIIANNRLVNTQGISDSGTNTVLDGNLTT